MFSKENRRYTVALLSGMFTTILSLFLITWVILKGGEKVNYSAIAVIAAVNGGYVIQACQLASLQRIEKKTDQTEAKVEQGQKIAQESRTEIHKKLDVIQEKKP